MILAKVLKERERENMRRIKVIYGDGTTERYCVNVSYAEALELARRQAQKMGTYVRGFSCVRI